MTPPVGRDPNPYAPPEQDDGRAPPRAFTGERDESQPGVLRYRYVPRLRSTLLAVLFFGVALVFYVWRAAHNDRGLIINGLIELETSGATTFYTVLAAASAGFVAIGLWAIAAHFRAPSYLVLDDAALSIPSRFGRKPRCVPYASIRGVELLNVQGQSMLKIVTESAPVSIAAMMLTSDAQLLEIGEVLRSRVRGLARPRAVAP